MCRFVNFRAGPFGAVCSPYVLDGDSFADPPALMSLPWDSIPILVRDKDVLLATHGFNVSYQGGVTSLGRLEAALQIRPNEAYFGVLWPGDWIIPAINYPFEDGIASKTGKLLADFCNRWLASARTISFLSHSLGARVILEAIKGSARRVRHACITAGAVNNGCLLEEYAAAGANCDSFLILSSRADRVLEFAYPPGDALADLLDPDHSPFEAAIGRAGPAAPIPSFTRLYQIPDDLGYDHGDYLPPSNPAAAFPDPAARFTQALAFMAAAFRGVAPAWPPS